MEQTPTHTIGGHEIKEFRKLPEPVIRYENTTMIYAGIVMNDYTLNWQDCQWDANGKVINRNVPRYDIDIANLNK